MIKRNEKKIQETTKHEYFLVDTECTKFFFKSKHIDFGVYVHAKELDELIAQGFEFVEKRDKTK